MSVYSPPVTNRPHARVANVVSLITAVLVGAAVWIHLLRRQVRAARREAHHDQLTGLPNRAAALPRLRHVDVRMIALLDLDGFKNVNDRYGHRVGDELLVSVAARLTDALGRHASAARLSGDEFLLIWNHRPADPILAGQHILSCISQPVIIDGHTLRPSGSLGIAIRGPHLHGTALLPAADHAMYTAKAVGPGGVHVYAGSRPPPPADRRRIGLSGHA